MKLSQITAVLSAQLQGSDVNFEAVTRIVIPFNCGVNYLLQ